MTGKYTLVVCRPTSQILNGGGSPFWKKRRKYTSKNTIVLKRRKERRSKNASQKCRVASRYPVPFLTIHDSLYEEIVSSSSTGKEAALYSATSASSHARNGKTRKSS